MHEQRKKFACHFDAIRTAPPIRGRAARSHRSRRGFALGKSRLSLKIDPDSITTGKRTPVTGQSTPASTSSSCGSDALPWWEVEYQCPPPGHLGVHVVPVSTEEQVEDSTYVTNEAVQTSSMTKSTEGSTRRRFKSVERLTFAQTESILSPKIIQPGIDRYENIHRALRGPRSKILTTMASSPGVLTDSSPSQKRKIRPHDMTECETSLFSTPVTKELKRVHESRLKILSNQVTTPSTFVHPLTRINIGQLHGHDQASNCIDKMEDDERPVP
ncbi:unnamed protein product [Peronospora belbahrii]|uniref:Uncharacterized protein n=1 Tax=Peronospora belbahrii TaxID=622444 RepID=A0AAU9KM31_9STRA|nr:unnamed protein product [Peronospora belbahrii]